MNAGHHMLRATIWKQLRKQLSYRECGRRTVTPLFASVCDGSSSSVLLWSTQVSSTVVTSIVHVLCYCVCVRVLPSIVWEVVVTCRCGLVPRLPASLGTRLLVIAKHVAQSTLRRRKLWSVSIVSTGQARPSWADRTLSAYLVVYSKGIKS